MAGAVVTMDCRAADIRLPLPRSTSLAVRVPRLQAGWVEIEESGADIALVDGPTATAEITVPPRYGRFLVRTDTAQVLQIKRLRASNTHAQARIALHCEPSASEQARAAWYGHAATLSARLAPMSHDVSVDALLADIAHLDERAPDASAHALSKHLRAQALYVAGRASDSVAEFANAETAWIAAGDPSRALVARVGRVEDLMRSGNYRDAFALTVFAFKLGESDRFFANRLGGNRCLALNYLGELRQALPCYEKVVAALRVDDEKPELGNMLLDIAEVAHYLGKPSEAEKDASQIREIAGGPDAPILRGRAELLLADLLLERGDIARALGHFDNALAEFSSAHAARWEANAMLRLASVYGEFAALDEAQALVDAALTKLSEKDAPARVAAALVSSTRIAMRAGRMEDALRSARSAEAIYVRLGMPIELDSCRVVLAEVLLKQGETDAAASAIDDLSGHSMLNAQQWDLLDARLSLTRSQLDRSHRVLARLRGERLSLAEQIEFSELQARWWAQSGDRARARQLLLHAAQKVDDIADHAGNPVLGELLSLQIAPLRSLALQLILEDESTSAATHSGDQHHKISAAAEEAWRWLRLANPESRARIPPSLANRNVNAFDKAVAHELLADSRTRAPADTAAARSLFSVLSSGRAEAGSPSKRPRNTLRDLQLHLRKTDAFVAHLDADTRGGLLWVTPDQVTIVTVPLARVLRERSSNLLHLISTPASPISAVHSAAIEVSAQLLAAVPMSPQPKRLLIEADAILGAIPWAVLYWPGSERELVEDTETSFVRPQSTCCSYSDVTPSSMHVIVAAQERAAVPSLSTLPNASREAGLISTTLADAHASVRVEQAHGRDALFRALDEVGSWVHIAAHGRTQPNRIGHSGLWLDAPRDGISTHFISGIDILDHGVRSDLVVLNACELGRPSGDDIRPSLNFAEAVARAGADHVVTALWEISDTATALWVPRFYGAILQRGHVDIDGALRQGQLALRADRNFHHPFYWASLVQIQGMEIGGSLRAPGNARTHATMSGHAPVKQQHVRPAPKPATTPR